MRRGRVVLLDGQKAGSEEWVSSTRAALDGTVVEPPHDTPLDEQPALWDRLVSDAVGEVLIDGDVDDSEWLGSLTGRVSTDSLEPARAAAGSAAAVEPVPATAPRMSPLAITDLRSVLEDEVTELLLRADEVADSAASLHQDAAASLGEITARSTDEA